MRRVTDIVYNDMRRVTEIMRRVTDVNGKDRVVVGAAIRDICALVFQLSHCFSCDCDILSHYHIRKVIASISRCLIDHKIQQ